MTQRKYSRQREAILHFLEGRRDHPTAEVIFSGLRSDFPNISLGTVYRNLALLSDDGTIRSLPARDGKEHYDWDVSPHSHFICAKCGAVTDIPVTVPKKMLESASKESGGEVREAQLYFHGICEKCMQDD